MKHDTNYLSEREQIRNLAGLHRALTQSNISGVNWNVNCKLGLVTPHQCHPSLMLLCLNGSKWERSAVQHTSHGCARFLEISNVNPLLTVSVLFHSLLGYCIFVEYNSTGWWGGLKVECVTQLTVGKRIDLFLSYVDHCPLLCPPVLQEYLKKYVVYHGWWWTSNVHGSDWDIPLDGSQSL